MGEQLLANIAQDAHAGARRHADLRDDDAQPQQGVDRVDRADDQQSAPGAEADLLVDRDLDQMGAQQHRADPEDLQDQHAADQPSMRRQKAEQTGGGSAGELRAREFLFQ